MTYTIADQYIENLTKKVARIQRKCADLGLPFAFEIGKATTITHIENLGNGVTEKHLYPAHEVEVSGLAKINGWTLIGKIEHTETGNLLLSAPDKAIPEEYRNAEPKCDHCRSKKNRKETFVIVNEEGEYRQIGRSCLKLYTDGMDAEACAQYAAIAYELQTLNGSFERGFEEVYDVELYVAVCYSCIKDNGYDRYKLSDYVYRSFHWNDRYKDVPHCLQCLEKYGKEAKEIVSQARSVVGVTDYLANVKVALSADCVSAKRQNLIASYVYVYIKNLAKAEKKAEDARVSEHVGKVGERIEIKVPVVNGFAYRVLYTKSYSVGWNRTSYVDVLELRDADGNVYKWSASSHWEIDNAIADGAKEIVIKATVKEHSEYRGVKQTVIQRAKVVL